MPVGEDHMRVEAVDERDSRWEDHEARYRVYFFDSGPEELDWSDPPASWGVRTKDVTGAEYSDVLEYARAGAGPGALYAIALVVDDPVDGRGLVWLAGMDYNDRARSDWDTVRRERMARAATPHR